MGLRLRGAIGAVFRADMCIAFRGCVRLRRLVGRIGRLRVRSSRHGHWSAGRNFRRIRRCGTWVEDSTAARLVRGLCASCSGGEVCFGLWILGDATLSKHYPANAHFYPPTNRWCQPSALRTFNESPGHCPACTIGPFRWASPHNRAGWRCQSSCHAVVS